MKRELDHLAAFLHMAVDYKKKIGFKGQFYIEPKPTEPTTHQYDSDARRLPELPPRNTACWSTSSSTSRPTTPRSPATRCSTSWKWRCAAGALGSIDANTGDELLGWDTDQFPTDIYLTTQIMLVLLKMGGFTTGGLNFDAKVRRESFEPVDLFHAHIGGMDAFARGLKIAAAILEDGRLDDFVKQRYSSCDSGIGAQIERGKVGFAELEAYTLKNGEPHDRQRPPGDAGEPDQRVHLTRRARARGKYFTRFKKVDGLAPSGKSPRRNAPNAG